MVEPETVGVITVNWNGWANTLSCLAALRASRGVSWRLYIVDNASTDGSLAHFEDLGEPVTVIATGVNGGWTGGNNAGIRAALAARHPYVFLLNNDAFVEPATLAALTTVAASGEEGQKPSVLGPVHRGTASQAYDFQSAAFDRRTGIPHWKSRAETASDGPTAELIETAYVGGAGIFAHRAHFETVGLLDDRFYLNFDDTDWCARARGLGYPLRMVTAAVIRHIGSASIGGRVSPLQIYFLTRNRLLYAEKHCTLVQRLFLLRDYLARAARLWKSQSAADQRAPFWRGVVDYTLRRFGDCPREVRTWQAAAAAGPEAEAPRP